MAGGLDRPLLRRPRRALGDDAPEGLGAAVVHGQTVHLKASGKRSLAIVIATLDPVVRPGHPPAEQVVGELAVLLPATGQAEDGPVMLARPLRSGVRDQAARSDRRRDSARRQWPP